MSVVHHSHDDTNDEPNCAATDGASDGQGDRCCLYIAAEEDECLHEVSGIAVKWHGHHVCMTSRA